MALLTTTIGAYPKPAYVPTPDWFRGMESRSPTAAYDEFLAAAPADLEEIYQRATAEIVRRQADLGIDVPTDGEIRRENYIHYQCRNFAGIDFGNLTRRRMRNGAWTADVPTINGPVEAREPVLPRDYVAAQAATEMPVKMTLPGPMTILDSTANGYYPSESDAGAALADALNQEVVALVDAGCSWIQVDEPAFARRPEDALAYGFDNLDRCFADVPNHVNRVVHMCCGYPLGLDDEDYEKADPAAYLRLASGIEGSTVDAVSIEDAHRYNDLELLERLPSKTVVLGSVAVARSRVETDEEIAARLNAALEHIDPERLIVAPDCGLGLLPPDLVERKLRAMTNAAARIDG